MPESYQTDSNTPEITDTTSLENGLTSPESHVPCPWYRHGDFFKPWEQTADADMARMMRLQAQHLLYVATGNDFPYLLATAGETGVWQRDPAYVDKLLAATGITWVKDAAVAGLESKEFVAIAKWQTRGANRVRRDKTLGSAGRVFLDWEQRGIVPPQLTYCKESDLDSDRRYLGAPNGVIDLDTGNLLTGHTARRKLVTRRVPDQFDLTAQHDDVDRIFAHLEPTIRNYLLNAFASAVRSGPARRIYALVGKPNGGKSTATGTVMAALGGKETGYAMSVEGGSLVQPRFNRPHGHQGGFFGIQDVLIASAGDLPDGRERVNAGVLKTFDGVQPVAVREVGEKAKDSRPAKATLFLSINEDDKGRLDVSEDGFRDRIKILPYPELPDKDPGFMDRVREDPKARQAMLALIVRQIVAMKKKGQTAPPVDPPSVKDAINDRWLASIGEMGEWLIGNVVQDETAALFTNDLIGAIGEEFQEKEGRYDGRTRKDVLALAASVCKLPPARNRRRSGRSGRAYDGFRLLSHDRDELCKYCGDLFLAARGDPKNAACDACSAGTDKHSAGEQSYDKTLREGLSS